MGQQSVCNLPLDSYISCVRGELRTDRRIWGPHESSPPEVRPKLTRGSHAQLEGLRFCILRQIYRNPGRRIVG